MNFFNSRQADQTVTGRERAYEKGRRDARSDADMLSRERDAAAQRAYERGRRDERARHHGHPVLAAIGLLAVAAVGFVVYLGVREGSFAGGGQVIDRNLAGAAQSTQQATGDAASRAGAALQSAGQNLKQASSSNG